MPQAKPDRTGLSMATIVIAVIVVIAAVAFVVLLFANGLFGGVTIKGQTLQ